MSAPAVVSSLVIVFRTDCHLATKLKTIKMRLWPSITGRVEREIVCHFEGKLACFWQGFHFEISILLVLSVCVCMRIPFRPN